MGNPFFKLEIFDFVNFFLIDKVSFHPHRYSRWIGY